MLTSKTPWIILLILWMIGSTWWHVCKIKQVCPNDMLPTTQAGADGYTIADGNLFRLDLPGNFSFAKSGANANLNTLGGSLESMVAYLKANPGRTVEITGYYDSRETNASSFANLGLARAEGIKQYLVQQSIPTIALTTKGVERGLPFTTTGDSLRGGVDFAFGGTEPAANTTPAEPSTPSSPPSTASTTMPKTEKELAEAEKFTSIFKPIDLYFPMGEANYIKTTDTQRFFDEATKFLTTNKDKKLLLTGHTDDSGPAEVNMRLSRDRANEVKAKLRKSGIKSEQIVVKAKGESEPKADNKTAAGRKANRRVTVVVQ
jgi:OOP family OmpA-OmpF porin